MFTMTWQDNTPYSTSCNNICEFQLFLPVPWTLFFTTHFFFHLHRQLNQIGYFFFFFNWKKWGLLTWSTLSTFAWYRMTMSYQNKIRQNTWWKFGFHFYAQNCLWTCVFVRFALRCVMMYSLYINKCVKCNVVQ